MARFAGVLWFLEKRIHSFSPLENGRDLGPNLNHVAIEPDLENVMIDATIVRVHQHGAGAKGGSNFRQSEDPEAD
ncbi:hypothetical protein ACFCP7_27700 [Paenibacillus elgii]